MPEAATEDVGSDSAAEAAERAAAEAARIAAEKLAAELAEQARQAFMAEQARKAAESKAAEAMEQQQAKEKDQSERVVAKSNSISIGDTGSLGITVGNFLEHLNESLPAMTIFEPTNKLEVSQAKSKPGAEVHSREAADKSNQIQLPEKDKASPAALAIAADAVYKELKDPGFLKSPNAEKLVNQINSIPPEQKHSLEKLYSQFHPGQELERDLKQRLSPIDALKVVAALNEGGPKEKISQIDVVLQQVEDTVQRRGGGGRGGSVSYSLDSAEHKRSEKDLIQLVSVMNSKDLKELNEQCLKEHNLSLKDYVLKNHSSSLSSEAKDVLGVLTEKGSDKRTDADCLHLGRVAVLNQDPDLLKIAFGEGHRDAARKFVQNGGLSVIESNFTNETDRKLALDYVKLGHASLSTLLDADKGALFGRTNLDEIKQAIDGVSQIEREQFALGLKLLNFPPMRPLSEQEQNAVNRYKEIDNKLHGIYDADKIGTPLNERQIAGLESRMVFGKDNLIEKITELHSDGQLFGWGQGHDKEKVFQTVEQMSESDWKQLKTNPLYLKELKESLNTFASPEEASYLKLLLEQKTRASSFDDSRNYQREVLERITDSQTGLFGSTDKLKVLSAVSELTLQEQERLNPASKKYDRNFADTLDQRLQKTLGKESDEYFAAKSMVNKAEHGEKPASDLYAKLLKTQLSNSPLSETMYAIEDTLKQPGALDRYKNPTTDDDIHRKNIIQRALTAAVYKSGEVHQDDYGKSNFNDVYSKYERMLLNNGGQLPISENVRIAESHTQALETFLKYATPEEKQLLTSVDPSNSKADDLRNSLRNKLNTEELQILMYAVVQEKAAAGNPSESKPSSSLKPEDYLRAYVVEPYHTAQETQFIKEQLKNLRDAGKIEAVSNTYMQKYGSDMKTAVIEAACKQDKDDLKELVKGYTSSDFSTLANTLQDSKDAQSGLLGEVRYGTKVNHEVQVTELADKMAAASKEFKELPESEKRQLVENIINQRQKWEESKASVAHGAVDSAVFVGSVALGVASGGSFTALELAALGVTAATIDVSTKRLLEGTQYKPEEARADFISQAVMFPLMMFGPGEALSATGFGARATERVASRFMENASSKGLDKMLVENAEKKLAKELQEVVCRAKVNGTGIPAEAADKLVDDLVKPTLGSAEREAAKAEVQHMVTEQLKRMNVELSFVEKLGKQTSDQVLATAGETAVKVPGQADLKLIDALSETGKKRLETHLDEVILKASQNGRDYLQKSDLNSLAWDMLKPSLSLEQRQSAKEALVSVLSISIDELAPKVAQQTLVEQAEKQAVKYTAHSTFGAGVGAAGSVFNQSLRLDSKQAPDEQLKQLIAAASEGAKFGATLSTAFHVAGDSFNLSRRALEPVVKPISDRFKDAFFTRTTEVNSKVTAEAIAKMDAEFSRLSDPQQKRAIELTFEDLKRVAVSPNKLDSSGKPVSVYDQLMQDGTMTPEQKVSLIKNLSEVREHYGAVKDLGDGKIYGDQHVSWVHTVGELGRVLQLADEKGLSANERYLTSFAAMYSDSVKYSGGTPGHPFGNFFVHHLKGMEAAEAAMQRQNFSALDRQLVRDCIETHQGTPKEFMARLYTFPVGPKLDSMAAEIAKIEDPVVRSSKEAELAQMRKTWESMTEVDPNGSNLWRITKIANASPTLEGNIKTADGRWKVDFSPLEQKVLELAGIRDWYVSVDPKLDPQFKLMTPKQQEFELSRYKINQTVIDADCLENYAYGAGKFVAIRGEGTIFPDKNFHQSIKSVDDSALDALPSLSLEARMSMESELLKRKASIDNGLQQYMDKFYGQHPEFVVNGKRIYDTLDISYPQKLTAEEQVRLAAIESKLKEQNKLPQLNDSSSMSVEDRVSNIDRFVNALESEPEYKTLKFKGLSSTEIANLEKSRVVRDEVVQFFREVAATDRADVLTRTSYERALDQNLQKVENLPNSNPSDNSFRINDFRTRVQLELSGADLPKTKIYELANSANPDTWLTQNKGSDEYRYLQYRHQLEKEGIAMKAIERDLPELSLNTPASRALAKAVIRGESTDVETLRKYIPAYLNIDSQSAVEALTKISNEVRNDPLFGFNGESAKALANRVVQVDVPSLKALEGGTTNRELFGDAFKGVQFNLDAEGIKLIRSMARESENSNIPIAELVKNFKLADYGFRTNTGEPIWSKFSLAVHDLVDHINVMNSFKDAGLLEGDGITRRGYARLFAAMNHAIERDAFGRESELIASASYNTRSFSLMPGAIEPPVKIRNVVSNLENSVERSHSANQKEALNYLNRLLELDPNETSRESKLVRHVFSAVTEELQEQSRKSDRTILKFDNGTVTRVQVADPEYTALILDVIRVSDSPPAKQMVLNFNKEFEAFLASVAKGESTTFDLNYENLRAGKLSERARDLDERKKSWLEQYPDFLSRRAPVGRLESSSLEGKVPVETNSKLELSLMTAGFGKTTSDVSRFAERLFNIATESPVAKLPNSLVLNDYLQQLKIHPPSEKQYVFAVAIDNFKPVNDTLAPGHLAGDDVILQVGSTLKKDMPAGVFVSHLRGDTYVLVVPESRVSGVRQQLAEMEFNVGAQTYHETNVTKVDSSAPIPAEQVRIKMKHGETELNLKESPELSVGKAIWDMKRTSDSTTIVPENQAVSLGAIEGPNLEAVSLPEFFAKIGPELLNEAYVNDQLRKEGLVFGNRSAWDEYTKKLYANLDATKKTIGEINIDLNTVGSANGIFGATVGDQLIKVGAEAMQQVLNSPDVEAALAKHRLTANEFMWYRLGGDEFALKMPPDVAKLVTDQLSATRIAISQDGARILKAGEQLKNGEILSGFSAVTTNRYPNESFRTVSHILENRLKKSKEEAQESGLRAPRGSVVTVDENGQLKTVSWDEFRNQLGMDRLQANKSSSESFNPHKATEDFLWQIGASNPQPFGRRLYFHPTPAEDGGGFRFENSNPTDKDISPLGYAKQFDKYQNATQYDIDSGGWLGWLGLGESKYRFYDIDGKLLGTESEAEYESWRKASQSASSITELSLNDAEPSTESPKQRRLLGKGLTAEVFSNEDGTASKVGFYKAEKEARNLIRLREAGLPVPEVYSFGRAPDSLYKEEIIMEEIPGGRTLEKVLQDENTSDAAKELYKEQIREIYSTMRRNEVAVPDVSPKNLVVDERDRIWVIDAQEIQTGAEAVETAEKAENAIIRSIDRSRKRN